MKLNDFERTSALWLKIENEINERLETSREKNDANLTPEETATLRGTIKAFKEILSWAVVDPRLDL
jgi:hypothetical protein